MVSYHRINNLSAQDLQDIDLEAQTHSSLLPQSQSTNKLTEDPDDVYDMHSDPDEALETAANSSNQVGSSSSLRSTTTTAPTIASRSQSIIHNLSSAFNFLDRFHASPALSSRSNVGSGSENDGVFNNLSAKPDLNPTHDSDVPPTYEEASNDSTPPYWESTLLSPGFGDEIFIDGLPVGNLINFVWNLLVCSSFQFVGFLLTYILHTSHAAKQGSRAGLGITFISYGWYVLPQIRKAGGTFDESEVQATKLQPSADSQGIYEGVKLSSDITGVIDQFSSNLSTGKDIVEDNGTEFTWKIFFFGVGLLAFGGFIFTKACLDYQRARKMERTILQPPAEVNIHPEPQAESERERERQAEEQA